MTLTFEAVDVDLPRNTFPGLLSAQRGVAIKNRPLLDPMTNTLATIEMGALLSGGSTAVTPTSQFGPPSTLSASLAGVTVPNIDLSEVDPNRPIVVIIDVGMAFWNKRFQSMGRNLFEAMAFVDFDQGQNPISVITKVDAGNGLPTIGDVETLFQSRGNDAVLDVLAHHFPGSIYGGRSTHEEAIRDGDFAHGTAMADLVAGEKDPVLIGIELPRATLLDTSGDSLKATYDKLIQWALDMVRQDNRQDPVRILVPYAFLGGPQLPGTDTGAVQDQDPLIQAVATLLAGNGTTDQPGRLFVPMGNNLQDRLYSRVVRLQQNETCAPLRWGIPAHDRSPNVLEIWWQGAEQMQFNLNGPGGHALELVFGAPLPTDPTQTPRVFLVRDGDSFVGGIQYFPDRVPGWRGAVISLAETEVLPGITQAPTRPGEWQIELTPLDGPATAIDCWIKRDDALALSGLRNDRLQSRFLNTDYMPLGANGRPIVFEQIANQVAIRRAGSASFLASGYVPPGGVQGAARRITAGAQEAFGEDQHAPRHAPYSGLGKADEPGDVTVEVGQATGPGVISLIGGTGASSRVGGTSVAAALALLDDL